MKYLVPYDFTAIARTALAHAFKISLSEPGEIVLLHIAADTTERDLASEKFEKLLSSFDEKEAKKVGTRIRIGNIFKDISNEAQESGADLLIMGTHGAQGLQKVLGSHAIKVVTSSAVPFIITQGSEPKKEIDLIVLPVDLSHEKIQITRFAANLAHKFKASVHVVAKPQSDEFLINRLKNNITKVKRMLKKEKVSYEVALLEGKKAFHKEVMDYGSQNGASMYAIAHHPQTLIPQLEKFSQELITNADEIPVLIVNAKELVGVKSNYSFVGI